MATLVRNVHVKDYGWFGPAHGNAVDVPGEVAALITNPNVWDEAPSIVTPEEQSPTGNGGGEAMAESPEGLPGAAQAGACGDASAAPDFAWMSQEPVTVAGLEADAAATRAAQLQDLADLPDDMGDLEAFAELHDIAVHGDHTDAAGLRAAIRMVIEP